MSFISAMSVSVFFLIPTILVYLVLKELRENLRGKLLICYLLSLAMDYAIISFINISQLTFDLITCSFLGFTSYFFSVAAFLWLSTLCYDIWKNFKGTNIELNSRKNSKQFILYSLYVWLSAGLATFCIIYIELSPTVDDIYKPGIDGEMCSLDTKKWSAALYFYGPNLVILLFNFATFVYITAKIYKVRRNAASITLRDKFFQENAFVLLRLFLIMGISWLFDFVSYCMHENEDWDILIVFCDFANAIQGILLFCLFVLKPNVLMLLKKRFQKDSADKPRSSVSTSITKFLHSQSSSSPQAAVHLRSP
ncbi:G-protein coupled receptor Mth2-like [Calliphora vicina]|uniref:G-protein coupled receptor Mth2-like n=1 Tax=Calliphora vicina TaxID=7373 RepID=UPI00325AE3DD